MRWGRRRRRVVVLRLFQYFRLIAITIVVVATGVQLVSRKLVSEQHDNNTE